MGNGYAVHSIRRILFIVYSLSYLGKHQIHFMMILKTSENIVSKLNLENYLTSIFWIHSRARVEKQYLLLPHVLGDSCLCITSQENVKYCVVKAMYCLGSFPLSFTKSVIDIKRVLTLINTNVIFLYSLS